MAPTSDGDESTTGRKQVYRRYDADGRMTGDVLALADEACEGEAQIRLVMQDGKPVSPPPSLEEIRANAARNLAALSDAHRGLEDDASYPVRVSRPLRDMADRFDRAQAARA